MNTFLSLLFSIALFVTASAQDTITSYLSSTGLPTTWDKALYFKHKKEVAKSDGTKTTTIFIYQLWDVKLESPFFSSSELTKKEGRFLFCDSKRVVMRDISYLNDVYHGQYLTFYEDGKLSNVEWYENGKREKTGTYYYKNGVVSSIEQYEADSLISFKLFNEDGSKDSISEFPNVPPVFIGSGGNLKRYLSESIKYPQEAIELGLEGKCYLQFVVDTNGFISNVDIKRGVPDCPECDREAVRVIKAMPNWKPEKDHNRICNSTFNLPISFKLQGKTPRKKKGRRNNR